MSIWHFKSTLNATLQLKCTNTRVGLSTLRHPLTPTTTPSTLQIHTSLGDAAIFLRSLLRLSLLFHPATIIVNHYRIR